MQYGPDFSPVSGKTILVGPPVQGPTPVPVYTTVTVIEPPVYEPSVTPPPAGNVTVDQPYAVAVLDDGSLITNKAVSLDFSGDGVSSEAVNGAVTVTITAQNYAVAVADEGTQLTSKVTSMNFVGNAVSVSGSGSNVTVTVNNDGGITSVQPGTSINVVTAGNSVTINNTFTENVYNVGNVSGTWTPDRNYGTIQKLTLTGNLILRAPDNMSSGQSLTLIMTQDSTGNRIMDANVAYLFASGFQTLSTASGAIDMMNIFSDGTTYYTTLTVGYS
jgi:hypothetical protein